MGHVEEAVLPNLPEEAQHEISKFLISLLEGSDIASFRKAFRKRVDPYEIFPDSISESLRKITGDISAEELLSYLAANPIIFSNLCEKRIYIY